MKKIAIIIWDMGIGGVQRQVSEIVERMATAEEKCQIELWIQYDRPNLYPHLKKLPGVTVRQLNSPKRRWRFLVNFFWYEYRYLKFKPGLVLTFHDYLSVMIGFHILMHSLYHRCKLIIYEPNLTSIYMKERGRGRLANWLLTQSYRLAESIIVTTKAAKKDLVEKYRVNQHKITVICPWFVQKIDATKQVGNEVDIIMAGRLEPQKQPTRIFKILANYSKKYSKNLKVNIVGDGSLLAQMKTKSVKKNYTKQLNFAGACTPEKMGKWYKSAKLLFLPSKYEGLPLVLLEAGAYGLPVVTSDYPGVKEIVVDGDTGYICRNDLEMTEKIHTLIDNLQLKIKMGQRARKRVQDNFSEKNLNQFVDLLLK